LSTPLAVSRGEACRIYLRGELGKLAPQAWVEEVVSGLSDGDAVTVASVLSLCRNNGVSRDLANGARFELVTVPVEHVLLRPAEPVLRERFEANGWSLVRIACDDRVLRTKPYVDYPTGHGVEYSVLLARAEGEKYRVIDGMHRAIQLARNGEPALELCSIN
jgi:hypothetical protein